MERLILAIACVGFLVSGAEAQLGFPQDVINYAYSNKIMDPLLVQPLKYKYSKKLLTKPGFHDKDLLLQAKYKLLADKILSRQLKNLNPINYNQQNLICEQNRPMAVTNSFYPTSQFPLWIQQQSISNNPVTYDTLKTSSNNGLPDCPSILDSNFQHDIYRQSGGTILRSQPALLSSRTTFSL